MEDHERRLQLARESLEGLSVGDALGEALSYKFYEARRHGDFAVFRDGSVRYTDDTEMAIGIVETLGLLRAIDQDALAWRFSTRFTADPHRGYGRMARRILEEIAVGADWRSVSSTAFGGGSFGNGAAMRVAPLGAYHAGNIEAVPEAARRSAEVTHYHPEGIAGAVAVAVASAEAATCRGLPWKAAGEAVWEAVLEFTPESEVRRRLELARRMGSATAAEAARTLGNGAEVSAQDTVPFCIWSACRHLDDFAEAFFETIAAGGDCDTNCAIVGGIVAAHAGVSAIPVEWLRVREPLQIKR